VVFSFGGDEFLRYKPGVITNRLGCFFREAIHLDIKSDMAHDIYDESMERGLSDPERIFELGKERLIRVKELSYMTGVKPDIISRITPGKLNVYLHMAAAKRSGMLIPDVKKHTERPKSLTELRKMDKGGTIFYPKPGTYEDVAKCDFSSMYPNIIVKYNISPETMHCACCIDPIIVPGSGWKICRRPGIIPQGIGQVLRRRLELKKEMKAESDPMKKRELDLRQKALKNILVTCFGYLGFKNFIFSNVECKECVMLYGRHILERTKIIAEEEGFEVLYGVVDSVFIKKENASMPDYRHFVNRVSEEFGFDLELDCVFGKLAFPSSDDGSGVANKYYGISGENIEARGIAIRHSDSPPFIKEFQGEAIWALFKDGRNGLEKVVCRYQEALLTKSIQFESLIIHKSIRRTESLTNQPHIVAYRQLRDERGYVDFVFTVYGPKPASMAHKDEINVRAYFHLLKKAAQELVLGL
jgi:DNA polymerase elongation subunit (family B)